MVKKWNTLVGQTVLTGQRKYAGSNQNQFSLINTDKYTKVKAVRIFGTIELTCANLEF